MNVVKDEAWKSVLINASMECMTEVEKQKTEIIRDFEKPPFKVSLKECDVSHMVYLTCVHLESFAASFSSVILKSEIFIFHFCLLELP